jgi:formamidopyrimidine-DNA glycosylase
MPELPEVETTVRGLNKKIVGLKIIDVWTDYYLKTTEKSKQTIKNKAYFLVFKKRIRGQTVIGAERIGKNIIMHLSSGDAILTHLKMTGHFLYGRYAYDKKRDAWQAKEEGPLLDPYNRFIRLVFSFQNKKHLALSDVRRFAKVLLINKNELPSDLQKLGPNPLAKDFSFRKFENRLQKSGPIKSVLMNQEVLAGVGNIYSDEALWLAGIHPLTEVSQINRKKVAVLFTSLKEVLRKSLRLGGDSTSDYRNLEGRRGGFQKMHNVYRQKGKLCKKKNCKGIIVRIVVRGRSSHYCPIHQK